MPKQQRKIIVDFCRYVRLHQQQHGARHLTIITRPWMLLCHCQLNIVGLIICTLLLWVGRHEYSWDAQLMHGPNGFFYKRLFGREGGAWRLREQHAHYSKSCDHVLKDLGIEGIYMYTRVSHFPLHVCTHLINAVLLAHSCSEELSSTCTTEKLLTRYKVKWILCAEVQSFEIKSSNVKLISLL